MNNEQLTAYLKDESYLYTLSYEELKTLVVQYPYASNLRVLLLKKSYIEQNKDYDRNLQMAASYSTNRRFLYKLVKKLKTLQNIPENVILGEDYLELTELSNIEKMLEERHVSEIYNDRKDTFVSDFQLDWGGAEADNQGETDKNNSPIIDLTPPFPSTSDSYFTDEDTQDFDDDTVDLAIGHILSEFGTAALDFTDVNEVQSLDELFPNSELETQSHQIVEENVINIDENSFMPTLDALYASDQIKEKAPGEDEMSDIFRTEDVEDEVSNSLETSLQHEPLDFENLNFIVEISDSEEIENQIIDEEIKLFEESKDKIVLSTHMPIVANTYDENESTDSIIKNNNTDLNILFETPSESNEETAPPQYQAAELPTESDLENEMKKKADVEIELVNQEKAKIIESVPSDAFESPKLSFKDWLRQFKMTPNDITTNKPEAPDKISTPALIKVEQPVAHKNPSHTENRHVLDESVLAFMFESPNDLPDNLFGLDNMSLNKKSDYFEDLDEENTEAEIPKKKKKKKHMHELAVKSLEENDDMISETLADILSWQGNYKKSIEMYEKLCLLIPEKSDYFAAKIEKLRNNDLMNDF